jgi:hypothetical protein
MELLIKIAARTTKITHVVFVIFVITEKIQAIFLTV